jgi:HD-like signal output (HDOD) protein
MSISHATIISLGNKLAPAMATLSSLRSLLDDPGADLNEIIKLIRLDPALTFHVVRLSNSVLFGVREKTDCLDIAVGRVGMGELMRLVGLAATRQVCQRDLLTYRLAASRLWENAVATAAAAELLAERAELDGGLLYSAGLLRMIGRVVLDTSMSGELYPGEVAWPVIADWEKQTFGVTGAQVSVDLLGHWHFPTEITDAIRGHFDPLADPENSNVGACILNLACGVATRFGLGLPGENGDWAPTEAKLTLAGVTEQDIDECAERARRHFAALCASVA